MSTSDEVLYYLHRAKARVEGDAVVPPERADAVRFTRRQLEEALPHAHAGAEVPDGARLKPLKVAALGAMRPVTSSQGEFNHAVLRALDSATEALEQLSQRVEVGEQHANRIQAGVATGQLTVDDLVDDVRELRTEVAELAQVVAELRQGLGADRADP